MFVNFSLNVKFGLHIRKNCGVKYCTVGSEAGVGSVNDSNR